MPLRASKRIVSVASTLNKHKPTCPSQRALSKKAANASSQNVGKPVAPPWEKKASKPVGNAQPPRSDPPKVTPPPPPPPPPPASGGGSSGGGTGLMILAGVGAGGYIFYDSLQKDQLPSAVKNLLPESVRNSVQKDSNTKIPSSTSPSKLPTTPKTSHGKEESKKISQEQNVTPQEENKASRDENKTSKEENEPLQEENKTSTAFEKYDDSESVPLPPKLTLDNVEIPKEIEAEIIEATIEDTPEVQTAEEEKTKSMEAKAESETENQEQEPEQGQEEKVKSESVTDSETKQDVGTEQALENTEDHTSINAGMPEDDKAQEAPSSQTENDQEPLKDQSGTEQSTADNNEIVDEKTSEEHEEEKQEKELEPTESTPELEENEAQPQETSNEFSAEPEKDEEIASTKEESKEEKHEKESEPAIIVTEAAPEMEENEEKPQDTSAEPEKDEETPSTTEDLEPQELTAESETDEEIKKEPEEEKDESAIIVTETAPEIKENEATPVEDEHVTTEEKEIKENEDKLVEGEHVAIEESAPTQDEPITEDTQEDGDTEPEWRLAKVLADVSRKLVEAELKLENVEEEQAILEKTFEDRLEAERKDMKKKLLNELHEHLVIQEQRHQERIEQEVNAIADEIRNACESDMRVVLGKERASRSARLEELYIRVMAVEKVLSDNVMAEQKSRRAHAVMMATDALQRAVSSREPLQTHVDALRDAGNDPLVRLAMDSLPQRALSSGVCTQQDLERRFPNLKKTVIRVALVPAGGSVMSHMISWAFSLLLTDLKEPYPGTRADLIMSRADDMIRNGDLEGATREVNQLQGAARITAKAWLQDARDFLEVQQALRVCSAQARLLGISLE
eukprot:m.245846 g.245846  ORF g.245846 m.245846 type:complete len:855 (-) comp16109_c6_seq1:48-2612(-)